VAASRATGVAVAIATVVREVVAGSDAIASREATAVAIGRGLGKTVAATVHASTTIAASRARRRLPHLTLVLLNNTEASLLSDRLASCVPALACAAGVCPRHMSLNVQGGV